MLSIMEALLVLACDRTSGNGLTDLLVSSCLPLLFPTSNDPIATASDAGRCAYSLTYGRRFLMDKKDYKAPMGTVVILALYLILIVVLWGSTYLTMLSRGGTG